MEAVPGLRVAPGLREQFSEIETDEALAFVCELYCENRVALHEILEHRKKDREFMDGETLACVARNEGVEYTSPDYATVLGKKNEEGTVVVGPLEEQTQSPQVVIPDFLVGDQVTLFGPPDTAKMSINAMNAFNRVSPDEPAIVTELAEAAGQVPRWGRGQRGFQDAHYG